MKIGFIGAGNMASAIVRGIVAGGTDASLLTVYDIDAQRQNALVTDCGVSAACCAQDVVLHSDAVLLAVKPQVYADLLPTLRAAAAQSHPLIISIAAGKTIGTISALLGSDLAIVRAMPNLNARVGQAITALCANAHVTAAQMDTARAVFGAVGETVDLPEDKFSGFAAMAGAGPAFAFLFVDALAQAGVQQGIPKPLALQIARQTVLGSALMLRQSEIHPRILMDQVCSPGGITIEGVLSLQKNRFEASVADAVQAACDRDKQLV